MLKVLELFGGIGACTKALKKLGIDFKVMDYVEINKHSVASYNAINGTDFKPQDITKWDKQLEVDFIMHGSPCTSFSLAGKQEGGDEGSGTPSSLMYETLRIVDKLRPKYVLWENVENLLSEHHRHNYDNYLNRMESFGYTNYYKVLESSNYGIPQTRRRVFTLSILGQSNYQFPPPQKLQKSFYDYLEKDYDDSVVLTEHEKTMVRNFGATYSFGGYVVKDKWVYPTITASYGKVSGNSGKIRCGDNKFRILTPRECWRLTGFDDIDFDKASKVNEKSALYKQAGNSIVVNVLEAILGSLFNIELPYTLASQYKLKELF